MRDREVFVQVHLIIKHKNPSGEVEEKHLKSPPLILQDVDTHVYTAILKPSDNTSVPEPKHPSNKADASRAVLTPCQCLKPAPQYTTIKDYFQSKILMLASTSSK